MNTQEKEKTCAELVKTRWQERRADLDAVYGYDTLRPAVFQYLEENGIEDTEKPIKVIRDAYGNGSTGNGIPQYNELTAEEKAAADSIDSIIVDCRRDYGLSVDVVPAGTFDDIDQSFVRYQFSWGGPSDELRLFFDNYSGESVLTHAEYRYMDWGDGASVDVSNDELINIIWDDFSDIMHNEIEESYEIAAENMAEKEEEENE